MMEYAISASKSLGWYKKNISLSEYADEKIELLTDELKIPLTSEEREKFYLLESDTEIDRYARSLIDERL